MNTKQSRVASVISIIYNLLSVPFWGYMGLVLFIFLELAISTGNIQLLCANFLFFVCAILGVVNFIMAIVAFTYVGKKSVKYDKGKKFIITYIILMFVQAACNIALAILMLGSILLSIVIMIIALFSILCAILYLVDFVNNKKLKEKAEEQVIEELIEE